MSAPGGETAGGPVTPGELVPPIVSPDVAAMEEYVSTLRTQAEALAPGVSSADWEEWPEKFITGDTVIPAMVRAGSIRRNDEHIPIIVPGVGESHIFLGSDELVRPTKQQVPPRSVGQFEVEAITKRLAAEHQEAETQRFAAIAAERPAVVATMRGIMLRTVASMQPGSVRVDVYDQQMGADFRDFSALGNTGPGPNIYNVGGQISATLLRLVNHIGLMNSKWLQGAPSLRELARSGELPQPFILAVLLGSGRPLSAQAQRMLETVVEQGPACGVTLLAHGFNVRGELLGNAHRIQPVDRTRVSTPAANNISFRPDPSPPQAIVTQTTRAVAISYQEERSAADRSTAQADPRRRHLTLVHTPTTLIPFEEQTPGRAYNQTLALAASYATRMNRIVQEFRANFPLIEPGQNAAFARNGDRYLGYVDTVVGDPKQLRQGLNELAHGTGPILNRLQTWAAFQLILETPGQTVNHALNARYARAGNLLVSTSLPALTQTVAITAHHGQELLPEAVRDWATQNLHEDPPAYAFQLVADHATRRSLPARESGYEGPAMLATIAHLEDTYGVVLRHRDGSVANRQLLEALIECEVLRLYGANIPDIPEATLDAITRRSHRRLEGVDRSELPENAQPFYDLCMNRLKIIGRRDTWRETATQAASAALRVTVRGLAAGDATITGQPNDEPGLENGTGRSTPRNPKP